MKNMTAYPRKVQFTVVMVLALGLLVGCASTPDTPSGAVSARSDLTTLQNDSNLSKRVPMELREAEEAVTLAEQPLPNSESDLSAHRIFMANHKISIARTKANTHYTEEQRDKQSEQRESARLASRTAEVDRARRGEADLKRQLEELQAKPTERGIVLTLGDVLFATGSSELRQGADSNLNRLVNFLQQHPERQVKIEGHTDSVGSASSNQQLSQRRAESVRRYLIDSGIPSNRLSASGLGEGHPVASNDSAAGRQQNRRVEVVVANE